MLQKSKTALILALLALPLVELGLLIRAGQAFGLGAVLMWILGTGIVGVLAIRAAGLKSIRFAIDAMHRPDLPSTAPALENFLQIIAGGLLFLPGLLCDGLGAILLVPWVRSRLVASSLMKLVVVHEERRQRDERRHNRRHAGGPGIIIEGEYERVREETVRPNSAVDPRRRRD